MLNISASSRVGGGCLYMADTQLGKEVVQIAPKMVTNFQNLDIFLNNTVSVFVYSFSVDL